MVNCYIKKKTSYSYKKISVNLEKNECITKENCEEIDENCFYQIPCQQIYPKYLTPGSQAYTNNIAIIIELENECLYVPENTRLTGFTIESTGIRVLRVEGEKTKKWEPIAYTMSKKGIIRRLKIPYEGTIILIYNDPLSKPEKYIVFIDTRDEIKRLRKKNE